MPFDDWLSVLNREYLQDFIKNGGASVKFAVPWERTQHEQIWRQLKQMSEQENYVFASVDAAVTKVHMMDKLFHQVARQVDWDQLTYTYLCSILSERHYQIPSQRQDLTLENLAFRNGLDQGEMRAIVNNRIRENLSRDYAMTHDFRTAMLKLCQGQLDPQDLGHGVAEAVKEWLTGDLRLISALKSASIFQKVGRHSARDMLASLSHWTHLGGKSGLVVTLDISRFLESKKSKNGDTSLRYSTVAIMDAYEVLRQFIDSTDELKYCLMVVFAPPAFLVDEQRGVRKYDALYFRIWDEVRDKNRGNPLASLLRFEPQEEPATPELGIIDN